MAIAIDPASPALVSGVASSSTVTTASFNAPANSVLVACVAANASAGGTTTAAINNNGAALTWEQRSICNFPVSGISGYAAIFTARVITARPGLTVTVTTSGSTSTTRRPTLGVYIATGATEYDFVVGSGTIVTGYTTNNVNVDYTQSQTRSMVFVAACDWNKRGVATSSDLVEQGFDQPGAGGVSGLTGYQLLGDTAGAKTYNLDASGALAAAWNSTHIEARPAHNDGQSLLTSSFGANARLCVEAAWGANIALPDSYWVWTDITSDVRQAPGISASLGKADEASTSQPAICSMTLDNTLFKYSTTGFSPNYPNVKRNVPIRVSVSLDGDEYQNIFQGYATGFTPEWNIKGNVQNVKLVAAGTLRRLLQGTSPVLSPIRRVLSENFNMIAYWPLEEGKKASYVAAAVGGSSMNIISTPEYAPKFDQNTDFDASLPLPVINFGGFDGGVPTYTNTNSQQVRALFSFTNNAQIDQSTLIRVYTTGNISRWDLRYTTGGSMDFKGYDRFNTLIVNQGAVAFGLHGQLVRLTVELVQNGANVDWKIGTYRVLTERATNWTGTAAGQTVGVVNRVQITPDGGISDAAVGHVTVENTTSSQYDVRQQIDGYNDEDSVGFLGRLTRICNENGIILTRETPGYTANSSTDRMGAQPISDVTTVLREVETVDQGILYDGRTSGLSYTARRARENRVADLTISAGTLKLSAPFMPVDDDQRTRNKVEAKRSRGSSIVYEDVTGPLGTAAIGTYDTSVEVNTWRDLYVGLYAGWFVNLGTLEGYRYPTITVNLRSTPELADAWLSLRPGYRIDITDVGSVLPGLGTETISLMIEGISNDINEGSWIGVARCSPYEPWRVGLSAEPTGSTGEFIARADTSGSVTNASASAAATSLVVATTSGPIWTTVADNYPMELNVGGIKVTATACSGASSPQTFTVNALPYARAAGLPVSLWQPTRLGL